MKYIAVVNDKGELVAAQQADEVATLAAKGIIISPNLKPGEKVVNIDIPTEAAKKTPAVEMFSQLKGEFQRMKR